MPVKSGGLPNKLGCENVHITEGDCLAGDRMIILCRNPGKWKTSKKYRSGKHRLYENNVRANVYAKLEVGYTNIRK